MKHIFLVFLLVAIGCNEKKEELFTVEGTLKNAGSNTVYLELNQMDSRPIIVDSAQLDPSGKFKLEAEALEESLFSIRTSQSPFPFAILINDASKITLNADLMNQQESYSLNGSEASQKILDLEKHLAGQMMKVFQLKSRIDSIRNQPATDSLTQFRKDSLVNADFNQYSQTVASTKDYTINAIRNSRSPMFVLYALGAYEARSRQVGELGFSRMEIADLLNQASTKFPDHTALLEQKKKLGSNKASEISLADTSGNKINLSSFKGKYVLVDFWASWCRPCREENPNLVSAYRQFQDKNFTILGVSLDENKAAWLQAIKADSLTWTHVSDLKGWNNEAAIQYQVQSIPYNVLVDPEGNIIAEQLRGPQLLNTLQKVLK